MRISMRNIANMLQRLDAYFMKTYALMVIQMLERSAIWLLLHRSFCGQVLNLDSSVGIDQFRKGGNKL